MKASYKKHNDEYKIFNNNKHIGYIKKDINGARWRNRWILFNLNHKEIAVSSTRDRAVDEVNLLKKQQIEIGNKKDTLKLIEGIKKVLPSIGKSYLGAIESVLLYKDGDSIKLVGTDGIRIHMVSINMEIKGLSNMLLNPTNLYELKEKNILMGCDKKDEYKYFKQQIIKLPSDFTNIDDILVKKSSIDMSPKTHEEYEEYQYITIKGKRYQHHFIQDAFDQIKGDHVFMSVNEYGALTIKGNDFIAIIMPLIS